MSIFYPQSAVTLDIFWEDWAKGTAQLNKAHGLVLMPKDLTVEINTYKEADTASFTVDYANFPFEPRTIRNVRVSVSMSNMERLFDELGNPDFLSPTDITTLSETAQEAFRKKLLEATVFIGYADESEIDFNDNTREVRFECRDQTSLLIDKKYPRKLLKLDQNLFDVIRSILDSSPETEDLKIDARPESLIDSTPTIASISSEITSSNKNIKSGESVWDVINDLCRRVALIPYIELDKLVITKPRELWGDDPRRILMWGENLRSLKFKRKLGRDKGINIELRSLNLKTKKVIKVKYPLEKLDGTGKEQVIRKVVQGEVKTEPAPYHVFFVPDITSRSVLLERAEDIWDEMARQELEGSLSTKQMVLCDKENNKYNTLDIKMGTPLEIQIEPKDVKVLGTLKGEGHDAMKQYLVEKCYKPQVADALAKTFDFLKNLATPFYTRNVRLHLNHETGFDCDIDFINFIQIDPALSKSSVPKADG